MSWLELVPLEGGAPISLPDGQTVIGRGPFLGVNDKRVSRNHGVLENQDGRLRLKPTHSNPCFVQSSLSDAPRALERERWFSLRHGDIFSLLPGRLMYRVEDNTPNRNIQEDDPEAGGPQEDDPQHTAEPGSPPVPVSLSEDHKEPVSQSVSLSADQTQPVSLPVCEVKSEKEEEEEDDEGDSSISKTACEDRSTAYSPEEKRRLLPAWMKAASSSTKAVGGARAPKRPRANGGTPLGHMTRPRASGETSSGHMTGPAPKVRKTTDEGHMTPEARKRSDEDPHRPSPKAYRRRLHSDEEEESDSMDTPPATASQKQHKDTPPTATTANQKQHRDTPPTAATANQKEHRDTPPATATTASQKQHRDTPPATATTANQRQHRDTPPATATTANQKQHRDSSMSSTNGRAEAESSTGGGRKSCPFGRDCYRKNPLHFQEFSHHGDPDYQDEDDKHDDEDEEDRPECPYGTDCYRKNPLHRKEFKHTKRPARSSTMATKRRAGGGDDEDEESWDDGDSFIDDDSDDAWNDSDYAPPAGSDDSDGENIKRLQREAKAFTKKI